MTSVNIDEMMKVILRLKKKILVVMKQRDTAIEEARIACESRDAVIEEARIANESRDAIENANMVINNSLIDLEILLPEDEEEEVAFDYGVIEEVRIANESRDAAIEEARIANESRDAAIEEVRIANESRDVAISHLDKWKNKYERKEYLERLLPKDDDERDGKKKNWRFDGKKRDWSFDEWKRVRSVCKSSPIALGVPGFEDWRMIVQSEYYINIESGESTWVNPVTGTGKSETNEKKHSCSRRMEIIEMMNAERARILANHRTNILNQ